MPAERARREAAERKRVRELLRYYQPTAFCRKSSQDAGQVARTTTHLPHDLILTGLAQLGAYRTRCERAFVNLTDQHNQYVLAEAVRTGSLSSVDDNRGLVFGPAIIEKSAGLCPRSIGVFCARDGSLDMSTPNLSANSSRYIINDLTKDDYCRDKQFVTGWPSARFYAEVPIRSPSGYVLGSYCVVDNQPRDGIDEEDIAYMHEVTQAIIEHLEFIKARSNHTRADGLVKGLGLFVEGKSSIREWWLNNPENASRSKSLNAAEKQTDLEERADREFGAVQRPDPTPHPSQASSCGMASVNIPSTNSYETVSISLEGLGNSSTFTDSTTPPTTDILNTSSLNTPSLDGAQIPHPTLEARTEFLDMLMPTTETKVLDWKGKKDASAGSANQSKEETVSKELKSMFSRASNLIREAVELEGTMFLDACWSEPSKEDQSKLACSTPTKEDRVMQSADWVDSATNTSDDEPHLDTARSTPVLDGTSRRKSNFPNSSSQSQPQSDLCQVLGYSTRVKSSLAGNAMSSSHLMLTERTLRRFLKRYPLGRVFTFDQDGTISSCEEDNNPLMATPEKLGPSGNDESTTRLKYRKRRDAEILMELFPGVRSVVFFPLWDSHRDRWYAGTLAWTTDSSRSLEVDDLAYFAAFGNSIMAELARVEAISADRAKTDFISSISHELRSPLHGILGTAEILEETSTGVAQDDMFRMIEICGRTLLDVLDHLLDFAKINNFTNTSGTSKKVKSTGQANAGLGLVAEIDLADLIEDVVKGVFAGHIHRNSSSSLYYRTEGNTQTQLALEFPSHPNLDSRNAKSVGGAAESAIKKTIIIVNIDKRDSWVFRSQAGAWKRLLMNLFGNALKYTQSGSILIGLHSKAHPSHSGGLDLSDVTLSVGDTGRGMSANFLTNHLYKPFSQENVLSVGTGLGLSIVHQIAVSLGGTVKLTSEQGLGTRVEISATLEAGHQPHAPISRFQTTMSRVAQRCTGLEACLVGFDLLPEMSESPTGMLSTAAKQMVVLKAALLDVLIKWT